jgi:hypothetical protein
MSVLFCLCHGMKPTGHGKRKAPGAEAVFYVGGAGDNESSGAHTKGREGSSSRMRRAGARTHHQGEGACQAKKARSSMDWYGRSIAC